MNTEHPALCIEERDTDMSKNLTDSMTAVLDAIRTSGKSTPEEIAKALGKKPSAVLSSMKGLANRGLIRPTGDRQWAIVGGPVQDKPAKKAPAKKKATKAQPAAKREVTENVVDREVQSMMRALQDAGSEFKLTGSGESAKVINVPGGYATTDGVFAMLKDGDKAHPWTLYRGIAIDTVDAYLAPVDVYKSSTAACIAIVSDHR